MARQLDESLTPGPEHSPEKALWLAVIERAMLDLQGKSMGDGRRDRAAPMEVREWLGSKDFVRVRIGIAPKSFWTGKVKRPQGGGPLERFVLKSFSAEKDG